MKTHTTNAGETFLHRHNDIASWGKKNRRRSNPSRFLKISAFTLAVGIAFAIITIQSK